MIDYISKKINANKIGRTWEFTLEQLEKEKADRIAMIATNQSQIDIHQVELTKIQDEINLLK